MEAGFHQRQQGVSQGANTGPHLSDLMASRDKFGVSSIHPLVPECFGCLYITFDYTFPVQHWCWAQTPVNTNLLSIAGRAQRR